jgi:hypothetical protein
MNVGDRELCDWMVQIERERLGEVVPRPPSELQTIHHSELPEDSAGDPIARDWNFYRREVGRLLSEGHEGKRVLIKDEEIVGIWDTEGEARAVAVEHYLMMPVLIHRVLVHEPLLRTLTFRYRCPN